LGGLLSPNKKEEDVDYLTVKELAELKGCSERHVKRIVKEGKIQSEMQIEPEIKRERYMISVSKLPDDLKAKYYKQKRTETGIITEKTESEQSTKEPGLKYRFKGTKRAFDSFYAEERETIQFWINLLNECLAERSKRKDKTG